MEDTPSTPRPDTFGLVAVIAYLGAHALWRQVVFGPYTFVVLRVAFLLTFVALLLVRRRAADIKGYFVGRGLPPASQWRLVILILVCTFLCREAVEAWRPYEITPFTLHNVLDECVIAPVNEEIVFRGVFLSALLTALPTRPFVAVLLSATLFAGCHDVGALADAAPLVLLGLLLGWGWATTRSLPLCLLCHVVWNVGSFLPWFHRSD